MNLQGQLIEIVDCRLRVPESLPLGIYPIVKLGYLIM